jgi:hypothetical protein
MSHLSILPTVLRDLEQCTAALADLGHDPLPAGVLAGFGGEPVPVQLRVQLTPDQQLGWQRQSDGSLALVGDLQQLSRSRQLQQFIGAFTRRYAARMALKQAASELPMARIQLSA